MRCSEYSSDKRDRSQIENIQDELYCEILTKHEWLTTVEEESDEVHIVEGSRSSRCRTQLANRSAAGYCGPYVNATEDPSCLDRSRNVVQTIW